MRGAVKKGLSALRGKDGTKMKEKKHYRIMSLKL